MNLSALKSLIEKLADDGFTSAQEKLIALALAILDDEIQQCDIIETLRLGKKHCRDTLKSFGEKNVVEISGKRDIFYQISPRYRSEGLSQSPQGLSQSPQGLSQSPQGLSQSPQGLPQSPQGLPQSPQGLPQSPSFSPFCGESVQKNINSNIKKKRKKRDSNFSRDSQALSSTPPGEAGIIAADEAPTPALASSAPAAFLPAVGTANTAVAVAPETHQKIDYDVFRVQTGQSQPDRRVAAPAQSTAPATAPQIDWLQRLLAQSQNNTKDEFIPGTIFVPGQHLTAPLYNMLTMIDAPDPRLPLVRDHQTEKYLDFMKYIQDVHEFFWDTKNIRGRNKAFDDIIQRIAFAFAIELLPAYGITDMKTLKEAAEEYQSKAETSEKKVLIWDPMLRIVRQDFIDAGFGWRWQLANRQQTWRTEKLLAKNHGFEPRKYLFPAYHAVVAEMKPPPKKPWKEPPKPPEPVAVNRCPVLSRIAEKISEGAYNQWFKDAECTVDEANKELVFSARTDFTVKSINRHFTAELDETMRELGYVNKNGSLWKRRIKPLTESQEPQIDNAEGRKRKKPQRPLTIGQLGKKIAQTK